jgi:hypothetical protein
MSEATTMNDDNSFFVQPVDTTAGYAAEGWQYPDTPFETADDFATNVAAQCDRPIEQFHWSVDENNVFHIWMYPEFWPTSDDDV